MKDARIDHECEYCLGTPAWAREVEGELLLLCAACWADVAYCNRGGKEPAEP